ncbi:hypothetical protein L596_022203 [Steinernema carpocapsae]|uniref:Uncharacterized protein n=1 Tax=Steinernema carpocapsae TaxID=34508 RepID=A0A4V6A052_STECR|nr:hypothetical protein L596_022203 [Steinernema carpocapsae]
MLITAVSVVITVNIFISLLECYLMHENKISTVTFVFVFAQLLVSGILWTGKRNRSVILLKLFSGFQGFFIAICSVALVFCLYSQICMSSFMSYNGYKSREQERARMFLLIYTLMIVCHIVIASISLYTINKLIKYWLKAGNSDLESIDL